MGQANDLAGRIAGHNESYRGRPVALVFLAAAVILTVSIAFTYWMGHVALDSTSTLTHQRAILQQLDDFLSTVKDAETGQRGFLLTGREVYLKPYHIALTEVPARLGELRGLVSTGDLVSGPVERLTLLTNEKLKELERTIKRRRDKGQEAALTVVMSNEGERVMDSIRTEVAGLKNHEEAEYQQAAQWASRTVKIRTVTFILTALLNLAVLAWAYRRISRNIIELQRAREEQENLARFPGENPHPILRISRQGVLLYANRASDVLREEWDLQVDRPVPNALASFIAQAVRSGKHQENDVVLGDKTFAFAFVPFADRDYINVYAHDITERKRAETELRELSQRLNYHIENTPLAVIEWGPDMRLTRWSGEAEQIFGWKAGEVLGKRMDEFRWVYSEDVPKVAEVSDGLKTGTSLRSFSANCNYRKDGSVVHCEWYNSALVDESGNLRSILSLVLDVTERKRIQEELRKAKGELEIRVQERTAELQKTVQELRRSNDDLEQFAYISSHDLQEPLRMVASYVQLLEKKYKGKLDLKADEYIHFAVEGSQRMSMLIKDLLAYSRVSTHGKAWEPVPAEKALNLALQNLHLAVAESGARVTYDPLPTVLTDQTQLVQVFQNLIGNALKFRKDTEPPKIHISARPTNGRWFFSVRDNGIGIESQFFERIFLPFKRLHAHREKYPGSGIGLAIVKRIVEHHGGHIRVESKPGEGSTFIFSLPDQENLDCQRAS